VKRIHLVDLDGAKASAPVNLRTLETVASRVDLELEWGGGISSAEALHNVIDAGATHCIIGSVAARKPEQFISWLSEFGADRMILGADIKDGCIAVKGWLESTSISIDDIVESFLPSGLQEVICTDISRDGMLQGPSDDLYVRLQGKYPDVSFTVSGGISSMADIERLDSLSLRKVIVGKAIYENRISLKDIEKWQLQA